MRYGDLGYMHGVWRPRLYGGGMETLATLYMHEVWRPTLLMLWMELWVVINALDGAFSCFGWSYGWLLMLWVELWVVINALGGAMGGY